MDDKIMKNIQNFNQRLFGMKYFLSGLFLVFAMVQYNDADGWLWGLAYLNIAIVMGSPDFVNKKIYIIISLLLYGGWTLGFVPDFWHWIQKGSPSITGSMKAENPEVELVREFLGLIICDVALVLSLNGMKKNS